MNSIENLQVVLDIIHGKCYIISKYLFWNETMYE